MNYADRQVWKGEQSGEFTIRSAYKLLQDSSLNPSSIILQIELKNFYSKLWSLQLPTKITNTIWRIFWNYLPTLVNLRSRRVLINACCPRGCLGDKDCSHIFRQCLTSLEAWQMLNLSWVTNNSIPEFRDWLTWVLLQGTKEQSRLFCYALWLIWYSRNRLVHERIFIIGRQLAQNILSYKAELDEARTKQESSDLFRRNRSMEILPMIKIYFDAAFDKRTSRSASGVLMNFWHQSQSFTIMCHLRSRQKHLLPGTRRTEFA
ncbi:uncharacterized protein [Gossypium hirsutum]|uniref:Uncharacterized protein isoform X2 n=1 Tax=Gossypium hirsutum TaxID=3635 RepID=A0ABM3B9B0_GOSHI|nr:uncharacterized protein LOC121224376 isoform X2 [Gossypium hirsutum]